MSLVQVMPRPTTADYFDMRYVLGSRVGNSAVLEVERTILAPIHMRFSVRVMEQVPDGWREVCGMSSESAILYQPDAVLPDPVTLDWWTWGECPTLPPGPARIITTWTPISEGFQPVTTLTDIP